MRIGRVLFPDGLPGLVRVEGTHAVAVGNVSDADLVATLMQRTTLGHGGTFALGELTFLPPVAVPGTLRDFMAFEAHVRNCVEGTGGTMSPAWFDEPVFYFGNPRSLIGDSEDVHPPRNCRSLDYELEVAAIIGNEVRDLDANDPNLLDHVAGFTLLNDWSARDLAGREMKQGLGPAKGKDFATSLGPWVVTPDELACGANTIDTTLTASINGAVKSEGTTKDMHFTWGHILARASADATLYPGDVIGSGTVGTGCLLELRITRGKDINPWLRDGDEVVLESPVLGKLRNTVRA
jgi:fumarylacetoacetate (FAA) hydrolase